MANFHEELLRIADRLEECGERGESSDIKDPLEQLDKAVTTIGKAWSGSSLGYHARVYYENLQPPPPGANFSSEWGIGRQYAVQGSTGEWREFNADDVESEIRKLAGNPNLEKISKLSNEVAKSFEVDKNEVLSILSTTLKEQEDNFLEGLKEQTSKVTILTQTGALQALKPSGELMTRDSLAASQGIQTPPHLRILSETIALNEPFRVCSQLGQLVRKAGSHLARQQKQAKRSHEVGTNVFIGHGNSPMWRELKDFIHDRLHLPWDEFNRVPVAGITNIARLSEMLDSAAVAFLIMTGEDEHADGKVNARMNVVHEAGLFQGRLGFSRAIVVLEEGCEEFSNIEGLGQIRFPRGNIKAAFEEVRRLLEREGLLEPK